MPWSRSLRVRPCVAPRALSQVAERLHTDERLVVQWLRDHQLRGFKKNDAWLILAVDLNAFLETRGNTP